MRRPLRKRHVPQVLLVGCTKYPSRHRSQWNWSHSTQNSSYCSQNAGGGSGFATNNHHQNKQQREVRTHTTWADGCHLARCTYEWNNRPPTGTTRTCTCPLRSRTCPRRCSHSGNLFWVCTNRRLCSGWGGSRSSPAPGNPGNTGTRRNACRSIRRPCGSSNGGLENQAPSCSDTPLRSKETQEQ